MKFAIPKGSLEKATFQILEQAWYSVRGKERTYRPVVDDSEIELKLLRPQEIPVLVAEGIYDVGITGQDWIKETKANIDILLNLEYGNIKLVFAVPKNLEVDGIDNFLRNYLKQNRNVKISTEYLNIATEYIKNNSVYKEYFTNKDPTVRK